MDDHTLMKVECDFSCAGLGSEIMIMQAGSVRDVAFQCYKVFAIKL